MIAWTILHDLLAVFVMAGGAIVLFEAMVVAVEAAGRSRRRAMRDEAHPWGEIIEIPSEARSSHFSRLREKEQHDLA